MALILDLLVVALFVLSVYFGYRRGFVKTVSRLAALVLAVAVALLCKGTLAASVYDRTVMPMVEQTVSKAVEEAGANAAQVAATTVEGLPDYVRKMLVARGIDPNELVSKIAAGGLDAKAMATQVSEELVQPVALPVLELVIGIVLFLLTAVLALVVLRLLDKVFRLPVLRRLNGGLGLATGAVTGAIWVLVAVSIVQILAFVGGDGSPVNMSVLEQTHVVRWLSQLNPLSGSLQELQALMTSWSVSKQ